MNTITEILLTSTPLDLPSLESRHQTNSIGAVVVFNGTVRADNPDNKVTRLEFEAYEPMAIREIEKIFEQVSEKWEVVSMLLHHRLGVVLPGESAVIVVVKSRHRKNAFEACSFIMDELKKTVPIWKKEVYENGESWVSPTP